MPISFAEFLDSIRQLGGGTSELDPEIRRRFDEAARALQKLPVVNRKALTQVIQVNPKWVPILGLCVGLSQEQLKNTLRHRLGSAAWVGLARARASELIAFLDAEFALVKRIRVERARSWSYADILIERYGSRSRAGRAIGRGRAVEDEVEHVVEKLGLPCKMRTRFVGRGDETGPCDLAIPQGREHALIVCAIKGFDSTGSKLSDAAGEIARMAEVRRPKQFVFAIVDGMGWKSRQADLRKIHRLWEKQSIDGLYSLAHMDQFRRDLKAAARRLGLI